MDTLSYLMGKKSGSGPSGTIIDNLSITDNGHYVAPAGHAYNPVDVNIPQPTGNILLTDNGNNIDVAQYATATVNVQGGALVSVQEKDVNFYDYDGTVLYAYTAEEFKTLNALPANPVHTGLTAQGWNWSFTDAKTYVTTYSALNIGQIYTTSDGKTRLYITIPSNAPSYARTLELNFGITNGSVTVDYGDGSNPITVTSSSVSLMHDYTDTGDYVITLAINSGTVQLNSRIFNNSSENANRRVWLTRIEIGNNVTSIENQVFSNCYVLKNIIIPNTVTYIGAYTFQSCYMLQTIIIPNRITDIENFLTFNDSSLQNIIIPNGVVNIKENTFTNCHVLQNITLPSNITNIGPNAFYGCESLQNIVIPSNVVNINNSAFANCYSLYALYFTSSTPPVINNNNVWSNLSRKCKIYIPFSASIDYLTATNYPSSSTYTYIGYATYTNGAALPTQDSSQRCNVRWYPTITDAINQTNQITVGNGNEIYCRYV